jgi:DNA-binding LytR/AlgR family response regulator
MAHKPHLRPNGDSLEFLKNKTWSPVDYKQVITISSLQDYATLSYSCGKKLTVLITMSVAAKILLPFQFVRANRKYIVNLSCVEKYDTDFLFLNNSTKIRLGRTHKKTVRKIISKCPQIKKIQKPRNSRGFLITNYLTNLIFNDKLSEK